MIRRKDHDVSSFWYPWFLMLSLRGPLVTDEWVRASYTGMKSRVLHLLFPLIHLPPSPSFQNYFLSPYYHMAGKPVPGAGDITVNRMTRPLLSWSQPSKKANLCKKSTSQSNPKKGKSPTVQPWPDWMNLGSSLLDFVFSLKTHTSNFPMWHLPSNSPNPLEITNDFLNHDLLFWFTQHYKGLPRWR